MHKLNSLQKKYDDTQAGPLMSVSNFVRITYQEGHNARSKSAKAPKALLVQYLIEKNLLVAYFVKGTSSQTVSKRHFYFWTSIKKAWWLWFYQGNNSSQFRSTNKFCIKGSTSWWPSMSSSSTNIERWAQLEVANFANMLQYMFCHKYLKSTNLTNKPTQGI